MEIKETAKTYGSLDSQPTLLVVPFGRFYAALSTRHKKKGIYFDGKLICLPADEDELALAVRTLNQAIGEITPKNLHEDLPKDY